MQQRRRHLHRGIERGQELENSVISRFADSPEFPRFRALIPEAVARLPSPVRFRAENAIDGMQRARGLLHVDREMASFRAITAEEEAASALFRSLQLRGYPGSDSLNTHMHQHKAAAGFFLSAVKRELFRETPIDVTIMLQVNIPKITVSMPIAQFVGEDSKVSHLRLELAEPLGTLRARSGVADDEIFDRAVAEVAGDRRVDKLIARAANTRNQLLYAHDAGKPASQLTEAGLDQRQWQSEVFILLAIAVLQTDTHQPMARQCLAGFLKIIKRAKVDVYT